jgi:hypothetical protein
MSFALRNKNIIRSEMMLIIERLIISLNVVKITFNRDLSNVEAD